MDADGAQAADGSENVGVLLHFYTHRSAPGASSFVPAAVYELLGLAVNGIWKGLLDDVPARAGLSSLIGWFRRQAGPLFPISGGRLFAPPHQRFGQRKGCWSVGFPRKRPRCRMG